MSLEDEVAALEKQLKAFRILGADGSFEHGFVIAGEGGGAAGGATTGGGGDGGGGGGGGGGVCFGLSLSVGAPDCDGDFFVGNFTNPFDRDATMTITGTVDDDLVVDGVVTQGGVFPFTDGSDPPCPGSGVLNGEHSITYSTTVSAGQTVSVVVRNNFRGFANVSGQICFT